MLTLHHESGGGRRLRRELRLLLHRGVLRLSLLLFVVLAAAVTARACRVARGHGKRSSSGLPCSGGAAGGTPPVRVRPNGCCDRSSTTDVCIGGGRGEQGDGTLDFSQE
jgi:hypothetical protein